jgi:16S rRNA (uracil1498-N3)-methyltransferase
MSTRLFVSGALINGAELELDGDRARYLGKVLRIRVGDSVSVFNGTGPQWPAIVTRVSKNAVGLELGESVDVNSESPLKIHLAQGISRGDRMDFVVQKATELGVKRITPILTEYGVVKLNPDRAQKRRDHWQKIANSACEQSGRTRLPLIDTPVPLKNWLGAKPKAVDTELILAPQAHRPLASVSAPDTKVCVLIGPEGGFSDNEYGDAEVSGFDAVSLGPRILRTESAAIAALAVLKSLWGDLGQARQA